MAEGLPGLVSFLTDLAMCRRRAPPAKWAASAPSWCTATTATRPGTTEGCASCYQADELESLEALIPGIASLARGYTDVIESDGAHPQQGRPVRAVRRPRAVRAPAREAGRLPDRLALAKDRAAEALTKVMIPEALDYPA